MWAVMGRQPLGSEGRTVQAGLKITKQEEAALSERFGSPGKGLRAILDQWRQGWEHRHGPQVHGGPVLAATHELTDAPIDYGDHYVPFEAEVGSSVVGMTDQEMAAALALDQVKQSLPIGEHEPDEDLAEEGRRLASQRDDLIAAGVDPAVLAVPMGAGIVYHTDIEVDEVANIQDPVPQAHRHKRAAIATTFWDSGTKKHTYHCAVAGCPVVLS